jgi:hypothetical protein
MPIRIVDNKKVDMSNDEWALYQKIVKSYTDMTGKGEDLFIDLFESDDAGTIIFLRPPSKRRTSLEVYLFLMSLMQHQHLRLMHQQVSDAIADMKKAAGG